MSIEFAGNDLFSGGEFFNFDLICIGVSTVNLDVAVGRWACVTLNSSCPLTEMVGMKSKCWG